MTDQEMDDLYSKAQSYRRASWMRELKEKIATAPTQGADAQLERALHYPDHWDTAAYPDIYSALSEVMAAFKCECERTQGADARPVADLPDFPPQDYYASDRAFWDATSMRKFAHAYSDRVLAFKFSDYEAFNEAARQVDEQARPFREMMGIASRDAAPSDAIPEGCTPVDAQMLRLANHGLAQEIDRYRVALSDLCSQIHTFAEKYGEADFETGRAEKLLQSADAKSVSFLADHERIELYELRDVAEQAARATADRDSADTWVSVDERFPDCNERHGYSAEVLVSITCGNGLQMVRSDRYDKHSHTWEKYHTDYSYIVSHWKPLPAPVAAIESQSGNGESS